MAVMAMMRRDIWTWRQSWQPSSQRQGICQDKEWLQGPTNMMLFLFGCGADAGVFEHGVLMISPLMCPKL